VTFDPEEQHGQGPVIRDKRRIDPETGQLRERQETAAPAAPDPVDQTSAEVALAERTADLQRLQAEYLNYKRRVDRECENARATAVASTLSALLPVLDDVARAREHEELTGGFKAVAESLERTVTQLGLTAFGAAGDPFDPRIHEALMHSYSEDVEGPVCQTILQVGYQIGDRIVRPARVAVAEPPTASVPTEQPDSDDDEVYATSYDDNGGSERDETSGADD